MSKIEIVVLAVPALSVLVLGTLYARDRHNRAAAFSSSSKRILFPFTGGGLSSRALDAALRLALADHATLVPVFIAQVPMAMPMDSALPKQCTAGLPLLELIEQRATKLGVPVDSRVERGRTVRHALREAIAHERYDRLVIAAGEGFTSDDVAWLLDHAPGEVVIIRPTGDDRVALNGHGRPKPLRRPEERRPAMAG
jgi:hypothetical protein